MRAAAWAAGGRGSKLSTIRNGRSAALAELACAPPLLIGLTSRCFAHSARASCVPRHCHILNSQWSPCSATLAKLLCSLGLLRPVSRTARGLRAPHQFPLKSYGFSGAETARKRFLLWKMGFSSAKIAPSPPYTPPGTILMREGSVPLALSWGFLTVSVFSRRLLFAVRPGLRRNSSHSLGAAGIEPGGGTWYNKARTNAGGG